jgi:hypothetical protein
MIPDIQTALGLKPERVKTTDMSNPEGAADSVAGLWDSDGKELAGGHNYADRSDAEEGAELAAALNDEEGIPF